MSILGKYERKGKTMKTINEILKKVKENKGEYTSINTIDQELIKMRDVLLHAIEDKIEQRVADNPYVIDFSEKFEVEEIILNGNMNVFTFRCHKKDIFKMVLEELRAAGYQNVGSKIQQAGERNILYINILLYDLGQETGILGNSIAEMKAF